jgi:hypothetical protein
MRGMRLQLHSAHMAMFVIGPSLETSESRRWVYMWRARLTKEVDSDPGSTALPLSRRVVTVIVSHVHPCISTWTRTRCDL